METPVFNRVAPTGQRDNRQDGPVPSSYELGLVLDGAANKKDMAALLKIEHWLDRVAVKPRFDALVEMCRQGWVEGARVLVGHTNPSRSNSLPLMEAASVGNLALVELLLPYSQPLINQSQALRRAIEAGHAPVVERLLPLSPGQDVSRGICDALKVVSQTVAIMQSHHHEKQALRLSGIRQCIRVCIPSADFPFILASCSTRLDRTVELDELDRALCDCAATMDLRALLRFAGPSALRSIAPRAFSHWQADQLAREGVHLQSTAPRPRL